MQPNSISSYDLFVGNNRSRLRHAASEAFGVKNFFPIVAFFIIAVVRFLRFSIFETVNFFQWRRHYDVFGILSFSLLIFL